MAESGSCGSIRSRAKPEERCPKPATHGDYCGIHYKHPIPFVPSTNASGVTRIQAWWRLWRGLQCVRRHGIGYWDRSLNTNDSDFFSADPLQDICGVYFFSYKDTDHHVYGFDIRSLHTLLTRSRTQNEFATNPFTRTSIPFLVQQNVDSLVKWLQIRHIPTEWEPLQPPTPEQRWRMKVVDLFHTIDELNYYSSPDWLIGLNHYGHQRFYRELYDIWYHRAGLPEEQRNRIVPDHESRMFPYPVWGLYELSLEEMKQFNVQTIHILISSAADRNDRILGAMYVVSTLTLVNRQARTAYPWLYESVSLLPDETMWGHIGWIQTVFTSLP